MILLFNLLYVLLIMHMVRMFCSMLSRMIGLRLPGGTFFFPGFGRGISTPSLTSLGYFPVLDVLFKRIYITLLIILGPYLSCSATILSLPALLLFFSDLISLLTSSPVNGIVISYDGTSGIFCMIFSFKCSLETVCYDLH